MKKLFSLLVLPLLLVLVGCEVTGTTTITVDDSIVLQGQSSLKDSVGQGDRVEIYFGFSASEYLTQENANLLIQDSAGNKVTAAFVYDIPHFSEKATTAEEKKCSFIIDVPSGVKDGNYVVTLDLILGSEKKSFTYVLQVGAAGSVTIGSLDTSIVAGEAGTYSVMVQNGLHLTKESFSISMSNQGSGNVPTVTVESFNSGALTLAVSATNVVTGDYGGTVSISSEGISQNFTIKVTDVAGAEIESVQNITLTEGAIKTTTAKISNWTGLTTSDFKVTVAGTDSSSFTPQAPTASVTAFSHGTATITIDASSADAANFIGTLRVEGNEKSFNITVTEGDVIDDISIDWVEYETFSTFAGGGGSIQYTLSASEVVTDKQVSVSFEDASGNSASHYFATILSSFSSDVTHKTSDPKSYISLAVSENCPAGLYKMEITAVLGSVVSTKSVTIFVENSDTAEITANISSLTFEVGEEETFSITVKASGIVTSDSVYYSVFDSYNDDMTLSSGIEIALENFSASEYTANVEVSSALTTPPGAYRLVLYLYNGEAMDSVSINLTIETKVTPLTSKTANLYNPWGAKESAYNLVTGSAVMASGPDGNGKMSYPDSSIVDIALDNTEDIRDSKIVTELTSVNGGFFHEATTADFDNATDVSLRALCAGTAFTDNEAIMFDVGSVYSMKLANDRGYVIVKITSIDVDDTEGSFGNTGKMGIAYKYVSVN